MMLLRFYAHDIPDLVRVTRRSIPGDHNPLFAILQIHCVPEGKPWFILASF